ncbi:MAG TPA: hypothetical protein VFP93_00480, partial [Gammaproteobacteria bacterium]|nr:hypothetical protein [Gammaproteobacteria bacterium]
IMRLSKNQPCTLMLDIGNIETGHAMGFARNKHGIWLHDSNHGLIFFDAKNPEYKENFKQFFQEYMKSYKDCYASIKIRNTSIAYLIKDAMDISQGYLDSFKQITNLICSSDDWNAAIKTAAECRDVLKRFISDDKSEKEIFSQLLSNPEVMNRILLYKNTIKDDLKLKRDPDLQNQLDRLEKLTPILQNLDALKFYDLFKNAQDQLNTISTDVYKKGDPKYIKEFQQTIINLETSAKKLKKLKMLSSNKEQFNASINKVFKALSSIEKNASALKSLPPIKNPSPLTKSIPNILSILDSFKKIPHHLPAKQPKKNILNQLSHKQNGFFTHLKSTLSNLKPNEKSNKNKSPSRFNQ